MLFLIVLIVLSVTVAVVALQNGHAAPVSFLLWQFQVPMALVILASTAAGLVIGGLIGFARALRRWRRRPRPEIAAGDSDEASRAAHDGIRSRAVR